MNKWGLLRFLRFSLRVAFWPLVLVLIGGFPIRQGVSLGLLLAFLLFVVTEDERPCRFGPYWVRVTPNWYQILMDLKLIGGPEEWRSIAESARSSTDYCVIRDGVLFTVVQQSENFENSLIFWNQHQAFGTKFSFVEEMTPVQFKRVGDRSEWHRSSGFFMKPFSNKGLAGYGLGIEVPGWFWETAKDSCATALEVSTLGVTGTVDITLAMLPLSEFDIYRIPPDRWTFEYIAKTEPNIRKKRSEHRERLGWEDKTFSEEPGVRVGPPESIEHKYFTVEHREI